MPKRIAVIDIGSNTVRFVVYDGNSRSPLTFYNEKVTCRLGAGLQDTNRLNPDGVDRALRAMKRFQTLSDAMGVSKIVPVATAAVRAAVDGPEFCTKIKDETGLHVDIVSGEEEARLSALGVISGHPTAKGLICDMGGSSMELAWVKNQTPSNCISTPFAPLSMGSGARAEVNAALAKLRATYPDKVKTLYLVGGSFRALARLDMERRGYPLTIVQDYKMTAEGVEQVSHLLGEEETRIAASDLGISSARYELLPSACQILLAVLDSFAPKKILMSSFGLREGALYAALPAKVQKRDPLISAAEVMAKRSARFPEFGMALYDWLTPLFPDCSPDQDRLMRAACLLHDVNWRAHPDYRAEISFDTAARANLAGLSHSDRIFLGLALMHRYAMRLSSPEY
ncbi:MAG: Ppx/GppA phosphatase family protein, partial [Pseudomonadota bacterium]